MTERPGPFHPSMPGIKAHEPPADVPTRRGWSLKLLRFSGCPSSAVTLSMR